MPKIINKGGRPRKVIKQKQFEALCAIQCTLEEMEGVLGCCGDTIEKWCKETYGKGFSEVFAEKRGIGRASLRRYQYQMAQKNPTMAIWLGKQWLGQTDKQESVVSVISDDTRIAVEQLVRGIEGDDEGTSGQNP